MTGSRVRGPLWGTHVVVVAVVGALCSARVDGSPGELPVLGWWPFDDKQLTDQSGNSRGWEGSGGVVYDNRIGYILHEQRSQPAFPLPDTFTITAWVQGDGDVLRWEGGGRHIALSFTPDKRLTFTSFATGRASNLATPDSYTQVMVTFSPSSVRLIVDGLETGTSPGGAWDPSWDRLTVAAGNLSVADVAIYAGEPNCRYRFNRNRCFYVALNNGQPPPSGDARTAECKEDNGMIASLTDLTDLLLVHQYSRRYQGDGFRLGMTHTQQGWVWIDRSDPSIIPAMNITPYDCSASCSLCVLYNITHRAYAKPCNATNISMCVRPPLPPPTPTATATLPPPAPAHTPSLLADPQVTQPPQAPQTSATLGGAPGDMGYPRLPEEGIIVGLGDVLAVLSPAVGAFGGLSPGAGQVVLLSSARCERGAWEERPLPVLLHPAQLVGVTTVGGSHLAAALVGNLAVFVGAVVLSVLATGLVRPYYRSFTETQGALHLPSLPLLALLLVYQGLVFSSLAVLVTGSWYAWLSAVSLVMCLVVPLWIAYRVRRDVQKGMGYFLEQRGEKHSVLTYIIVGKGEWVSTDPSNDWARQYWSVVSGFRPKYVWGLALEFAMMAIFAALAVPYDNSLATCGILRGLASAVSFTAFAFKGWANPFARPRDTILDMCRLGCQGAGLGLMAIGLYGNDTAGWAVGLAGPLFVVALAIVLFKVVVDGVAVMWGIATSRRHHLQYEAYRSTRRFDVDGVKDGSLLETLSETHGSVNNQALMVDPPPTDASPVNRLPPRPPKAVAEMRNASFQEGLSTYRRTPKGSSTLLSSSSSCYHALLEEGERTRSPLSTTLTDHTNNISILQLEDPCGGSAAPPPLSVPTAPTSQPSHSTITVESSPGNPVSPSSDPTHRRSRRGRLKSKSTGSRSWDTSFSQMLDVTPSSSSPAPSTSPLLPSGHSFPLRSSRPLSLGPAHTDPQLHRKIPTK